MSYSCCRLISIIIFISVSICSIASLSALLSRRTAPLPALRSLGLDPTQLDHENNSSASSFPSLDSSQAEDLSAPASASGHSNFSTLQPHWEGAGDGDLRLEALATVDLGERLLSQQASVMLDEVWEPSLADQLWNGLLGINERERLEAASFKLARQGRVVPMKLASPWYVSRWPQIRKSVKKWMQRRRVYDPGVLFTLLQSVKGPIDEHYEKQLLGAAHYGYVAKAGEPYKSCAVVGNSGVLLDAQYGGIIDAHEAVFRLNNARIAGLEQHVGTKTTLAFVNSNVLEACAGERRCFCQPYGGHVPTVVYIAQPVHFTEVTLCGEKERAPLLVVDGRLDKLCGRVAKYHSLKRFVEEEGPMVLKEVAQRWSAARDGPAFHYSSGLEAVMMALGVCRRVSLFGFGKGGRQHHYHSSDQHHELDLHDYAAEYQFYRHLQLLSFKRSAPLIPFLSDSLFVFPPLLVHGPL
ncbi:hypothetical protein GOP47_0004448 [Adiantum capillus-veneris]|uniref:Uncharacterized protein n=1 Tax=Adiantum capillus-veneris TaxID=13818 RepID=A0A9D4ZQC6_ADICA|nr:hypothetical protein GOP47_0004448 [Adiantum capillus-veneris]